MGIFFIWLGLICCSVANCLIHDYVSTPGRYYYMIIPSVIAIALLVFHRIYTRDWCYIKDGTKKTIKKQQRFQVFGLSAMFSAAAFLSAVLAVQTDEVSWGLFAGSATAMVSFFVATARESNYLWKLLAVHIGSLIFYIISKEKSLPKFDIIHFLFIIK